MSDSSFDVDEILKEVRKRREENEERIKSAGTEKSIEHKVSAEEPFKTIKETEKPSDLNTGLFENAVKDEEAQQTVKEYNKAENIESIPKTAEPEPLKEDKVFEESNAAEKEEKTDNNVYSGYFHETPKFAQDEYYDNDGGDINIMSYAAVPEKKQKKGKKAKKKASKVTKILRVVIIVLLVLIIGGGASIYLYMNSVLNDVTDNQEKTETIDEWTGMDELVENFPAIYEESSVYSYRDMIKEWYYNGEPASSTHVLNVLLIGEDTRDEEITDEDTRADSAIIASVNIDTKQITLTSILRDSYCYYEVTEGDEDSGRYGKINEAMYYGGVDCYIRAVENNFKINIDNYVIVNFDSFESIVDTLGGITVEMTESEINEINNHQKRYGNVTIDAEPGLVDLDGKQALAFCRIRHIDSDNARADRQKTVLLKIFEKMSGASTVKSLEVANNLLPYVKMGFSKSEVLDIGTYALSNGWLGFDTVTQTVPENSTDENGNVITTCRGGMFYNTWCWKVDLPLTAQLVQQSIYGKTSITLAEDRPDFDDLPLS